MSPRVLARLTCGLLVALSPVLAWASNHAQIPLREHWRCIKWDGRACEASDLTTSGTRQLIILSSGYPDHLEELFQRDFDVLVRSMTGEQAGRAWSAQKRDSLLFVAAFTGGGQVGSDAASFRARVINDPGGRPTLTVRLAAVHEFVGTAQVEMPWLDPIGVAVLMAANAETAGASANATPPSFTSRAYGVALFTTDHLNTGYIGTHELAHAALNFLDEYVEEGFEARSLEEMASLSGRLIFDDSWGPGDRPERLGWDLRFGEILAGNGPVNLSPYRQVSTVRSRSARFERFEYEGGLFFGRGTYHDAGSNLMNSSRVGRTPHDGFALDHSPAQQRFIDGLFGDGPYRPNDRLRNAGPANGWIVTGSDVELLLYDGDKRNSFHKTQHYVVQVGWFERDGQSRNRWVFADYAFEPSDRTVDLPFLGTPIDQLLLSVTCRAGMTELSSRLNERDVCDAHASAFIPTLKFYTPYQNVSVPAPQAFTTYYWRFHTNNGTHSSGWTGWSSFHRSF